MKIIRMLKYLTLLGLTITMVSCNPSSKGDNQNETGSLPEIQESIENFIPSEEDITMYIGTYTRKEGHVEGKAKGIHLAYLNAHTGVINVKETFEAGDNPSFLVVHPTGKLLYAVNETGGFTDEFYGSVSALAINEDHSLSLLNTKSSEGIAPCHISLSNQGTHVFVANYVTGSITSFPTTLEGRLGSAQNVIRYKGKGQTERQTTAHAHYIAHLKNGEVISADLGTDSLRFHQFTSGQLITSKKAIKAPAGSGPRHVVPHPVLPILYVVNELNSTITSFKPNANDNYQEFQTISTLQEGEDDEGNCAAIKITPNGKNLYVSNRGNYNNIAIFDVDEQGQLSIVSHQSSLGNIPRDIEISPDGKYLVAANQDSDNLVAFSINQTNGLLQNPKVTNGVPTPVCIKFLR